MAVKKNQEFKLKVTVDVDKTARAELEKMGVNTESLGKQVKTAERAIKTFGSTVTRVGISVTAINQALELTRKAYRALSAPIKDTVSAYLTQERAETRLANTLRAVGKFTQNTQKEFLNFASALQETSIVGDEAAIDMIATAKAMGLTNAQAKLVVQTSADLAAVTGNDVRNSFQQLIMTFSGTTGRLAMLIPELRGVSQEQLKAGVGVDILAQKFSGFAAVEVSTLQGAFTQLRNIFGDFKEQIGGIVVDVINLPGVIKSLTSTLKNLIQIIQEARKQIKFFADTVRAIDFEALKQGIISLTVTLSGMFLVLNLAHLSSFVSALWALSKAFVAATLSGLKFTLVAAGVIATAAAVDILRANLNDLSSLGETIAGAFQNLFIRIERGFRGIALGMSLGMLKIIETLHAVGVVGDHVLMRMTKSVEYFSNQIDEVNQRLDYNQTALKESASGIHIGFSGEVVKLFSTLLRGANDEIKDIEKSFNNAKDASKGLNIETQRQRDTLRQIQEENANIGLQIINIGASQVKQLENQLKADKARIEAKIELLKLDGLITKENKKIEVELRKQISLLEDLTRERRVEVVLSEVRPEAAVVATGAQAVLKAIHSGTGYLSKEFIAAATIVTAKVSDGLIKAGSMIANFLMNLFDPNFWQKIVDMLGDTLANLPEMLVNVLSKLGDVLASFIESFPEAFQALLSQLPEIFARIAEMLPQLASVLMDALISLFENLPEILAPLIEAIPLIIERLLEKLPDLIETIFLSLGDIFGQLVAMIPDVIVSILNNLPSIIESVIVGLITAIGDIVNAFVNFLIGGGLEKIVKAFIKMVPKIAVALVLGIVRGLSNAFGRIFGRSVKLPKEVQEFPEKITDAAKKFATTGMDEASKLFAVKDFVDPLQKAKIPSLDEITDTFEYASEKAGKNIWQAFVDAIEGAWKWIWDIGKGIWNGLWGMVEGAWDLIASIGSRIWYGFGDAVKGAWDFLVRMGTMIWNGLTDMTMWGGFLKGLGDAFVGMFKGIWSIFSQAGTAIWNGLKSGLNGLGSIISNIFKKLDVTNLLSKLFSTKGAWGKGTVEKAISKVIPGFDIPFVKFAQGGTVPGSPMVQGDSPLNDRILAMLSPGEAVIPRSLMQNPFIANFIHEILNMRGQIPQFFIGGTLGKALEGDIGGAVSDVASGVGKAGKTIIDIAKDPVKAIVDLYKNTVEKQLGKMIERMIETGIGGNFFDGGLVYASQGGFVAKGSDTIPAMLSPGEFIVNAKSARANLGLLTSINEGQYSGGGGINIEKIEINAQTSLTPDSIRREVMPALISNLKRRSQDGEFVLSQRGIR